MPLGTNGCLDATIAVQRQVEQLPAAIRRLAAHLDSFLSVQILLVLPRKFLRHEFLQEDPRLTVLRFVLDPL